MTWAIVTMKFRAASDVGIILTCFCGRKMRAAVGAFDTEYYCRRHGLQAISGPTNASLS